MKKSIILAIGFLFSLNASADFFSFLQTPDTFLPKLPNLYANRNSTTVSGISSGAFMAVQLQVAHSSSIQGVASFAGGIWGCSDGDAIQAADLCMENPHKIIPKTYIDKTLELAQKGSIDDPNNLANKNFYIFGGSRDSVVRLEAALRLQDYLQAFKGRTNLKIDIASEHGFPTLDKGNDCDKKAAPWIQNCQFDGAGNALTTLYPNLKAPQASEGIEANIQIFSQKEFQSAGSSLGDYGYIYIPAACRKQNNNDCRVHMALHGCRMSPDVAGDAFYKYAGYNRWAEANKIIVIYPSVKANEASNTRGCWDWFGYTGNNFLQKDGKQISALKAMIDRVTGATQNK